MARHDPDHVARLTGADAVLRTLLDAGIEVCFSNPGTSEMHFIASLDRTGGMRCVLGLAETVVTGAADGYARIAGKPAATLLHTGVGLANGLANLHNARRGPSAVINIIGEHATYHRVFDTPSVCDTEGMARPVSHWVRCADSVSTVAADTADAIAVARAGAGRVATLILPSDVSWSEAAPAAPPHRSRPMSSPVSLPDLAIAIAALHSGEPAMLLLGGNLTGARLYKAAAIAGACGVRVAVETFPTRLAWGAGRPQIQRVPYLPEMMHAFMQGTRHLLLVGAQRPATFFAYPGIASDVVPDGCAVHVLAGHDDDIDPVLDALVAATGVGDVPALNGLARPAVPSGPLDPFSLAQAVAFQLPEGAIIVDEAITGGMALLPMLSQCPPHEWLLQTGGAIGWGLPAAVGAAIAAPDRKVVCFEGDGSALYAIQALWTMAREALDITVVVLANRDYAILKGEFARVGATGMGEQARAMMSIGNPDIDFVALAHGLGIEAERVDSAEALTAALAVAFSEPGPRLIEALMPSLDTATMTSTH